MDEKRIHVIAKEGRALIGNDYHVLEDHTQVTIHTKSIESLRKAIKVKGLIENGDQAFFVSTDEIGADIALYDMSGDVVGPRYMQPIATCTCEYPLSTVGFLSKFPMGTLKMKYSDFYTFIRDNRRVLMEKKLFTTLRDFRIDRAVSVEMRRDDQGNYTHAVTRESGGERDVQWPETVKFYLPVLNEFTTKGHIFEFDMTFDYEEKSGTVEMFFELKNPRVMQEFRCRVRSEIATQLEGMEIPVINGSVEKIFKDDSWKYSSNEL